MINTELLEEILKKKKDRLPALLEVFKLSGRLCKIDDDKFDDFINTALMKVNTLLSLEAQSKKSTGHILTDAEYKTLGIFQSHLKKNRRKSKPAPKRQKLLKIMPELYRLKQEQGFSFQELKEYAERRLKIKIDKAYFYRVYKKMNS